MKFPIFLDNHSTTPMDPRVLEAMLPYFIEKFGNAASRNHAFGWEAEEAVDTARKQIARLIKADPKEIVFTSGATESDNLALKGVLEMYKEKGNHIITATTEHRAVLDTAKSLEAKGLATVTYLSVDKQGTVNPQDVRNAITDKTVLISVMLANNEIGTINPVQEIGKIAKEKGIPVFCIDREINTTNAATAQILSDNSTGCVALGQYFVKQVGETGEYSSFAGAPSLAGSTS